MKNKDSKTDDIRKKTAAPVIGENIHFQKTVVKTLEEGIGDRQLVEPSDQVDDIRRISGIKEAMGKSSPGLSRQKAESEHEQVQRNSKDKIIDGKTAATVAGAWAGSEAGAAIGTMVCPGLGTLIGGICGGLTGALGISSLFDD